MKSLDVFGVNYKVIEKYDLLNDDGECCSIAHEIRLKKTMRDKETLIHELGHAILFEAGLYCAINEELREVIVQQFAQVITKNFKISFKNWYS